MDKKTKVGIALVIAIFIIFGMGYMLESNTNKYNKLQEDNKKLQENYDAVERKNKMLKRKNNNSSLPSLPSLPSVPSFNPN